MVCLSRWRIKKLKYYPKKIRNIQYRKSVLNECIAEVSTFLLLSGVELGLPCKWSWVLWSKRGSIADLSIFLKQGSVPDIFIGWGVRSGDSANLQWNCLDSFFPDSFS